MTDHVVDLEVCEIDQVLNIDLGLDESFTIDNEYRSEASVSFVPISDTFGDVIFDRLYFKRYAFIAPFIVFINNCMSLIILPSESLQVAQHKTGFIVVPKIVRVSLC